MTPLLPDACRIRHSHARDIAEMVVRCIKAKAFQWLRIYIGPDGSVCYVTAGDEDRMPPFSMVGTYDESSTQAQIAEDIMAVQREPIA